MRRYMPVAVTALCIGCSSTVAVNGKIEDLSETFSGWATNYKDNLGYIQIASDKGTICAGNFVRTTSRTAEGVFDCSDGRSGAFRFVSTESRAAGHSLLSGHNFVFMLGY